MSDSKTVVLIDQHPLWLDAVEQVLARVDVVVVGKATTLDDGTRLIEKFDPDLVVVEIGGSDSDTGLPWLLDVRRRFPEIKVLVLSVSDDPALISDALSSGVSAYVVKKAHPDDLAVAVRQAYEHSIFLPGWSNQLEPSQAEPLQHPDLTRRELEILRLVSEGYSNAELAKMLWVTEQTVKFHLSNIYRKLGVANRTEASRWAQLNGLLGIQPLRLSSASV